MKYVIVLGDGMADEPIEALGGKTPLAYAKTPAMDRLSKKGEIGMVHTIPDGMKPGSDTANLSVLGYDPKIYYSGRSPLEALSIGVPMKDTDIAIRCNIDLIGEKSSEAAEKIAAAGYYNCKKSRNDRSLFDGILTLDRIEFLDHLGKSPGS